MTKKKVNYKYMVSVDGTMAPKFEHDTLAEAIDEANRLSNLLGGVKRTIRILRIESVLEVQQQVTRVKNWINP